LTFSPDGNRLLLWSMVPTHIDERSMGFDGTSRVALVCIDITTHKIVGEMKVTTTQHVALCPDGETVALEAADHQSIRLRHLPTGVERCVLPVKGGWFTFTPDGKALF